MNPMLACLPATQAQMDESMDNCHAETCGERIAGVYDDW
jgi:hypothetical protein